MLRPILVAASLILVCAAPARATVLFSDSFSAPVGPNNVIANSYEGWNGSCTDSANWRNDGGTWFHDPRDGSGWSGAPDGTQPSSCSSSASTGSAMLRMWTHRADFASVQVDVDVRVNGMTSFIDGAVPWDGVKFYLRRQLKGTAQTDDDDFYIVEPFRREGDVHIQKKRNGSYYDAVDTINGSNPIPFGSWRHITIVVQNNADGSVTIKVSRDGTQLAEWTDTGAHLGAPITAAGNVGFRGDNADFNLDNFTISTIGSAPTLPPYANAVLATSGLVSFWRLEEASGTVAADSKGTNAGTYANGVTRSMTGATGGSTAVRCDGVDDHVNVPDAPSLDLADAFTYELWAKRSTLLDDAVLIHKGANAPTLHFGSSSHNYWALKKSAASDVSTSTVALADTTTWHHLVATKNGSAVKLYMDGADVTGSVSNLTMANTADPLRLCSTTTNGFFFAGQLDEVAVYNRALTASEVASHYAAR